MVFKPSAGSDDQRIFWEKQKEACKLHEADLERAGVRRRVRQPSKRDKPSSATGWK